MTDPVQLLTSDAVEDPPQEIVLAAVRQFRYRALLTIAVGLVAVLAFALVAANRPGAGVDNRLEDMLSNPRSTVVAIAGSQVVDGIEWRATETIWLDGVGYVRVLATETQPGRPEPEVNADVLAVRFDGAAGYETINAGVVLGRTPGAKTTNGTWVRYEAPEMPAGVLSMDVLMAKLTEEMVTVGGVSDDELLTFATVEFTVVGR
jgi:hypothetical protein